MGLKLDSVDENTENYNANLIAAKQYVLEVFEYTYLHSFNTYNPNAIGAINKTCFTVSKTQI